MQLNYLAIVAAAVAAFVLSMVWYISFNRQRLELSTAARAASADGRRPAGWKMPLSLE